MDTKSTGGRKPRAGVAAQTAAKVKLTYDEKNEWIELADANGFKNNLAGWIRSLVDQAKHA